MDSTARLGLPLLAAGQAQKDVTHNEALDAVDRLLALSVRSRTAASPPADPAVGDSFIVPAGSAWPAAGGTLMTWDGYGWVAASPPVGTVAFVRDEAGAIVRGEAGWSQGWPVRSLQIGGRGVLAVPPVAVPLPAGGAVIDTEARSTIAALVAALTAQGLVM